MPVSFLMPTLPHRHRRPWYARPQFYLPTLIVLLAIIFVAIYFGIISSELEAEAATYDLSKLEQMESASVILDRNNKIFGQIYVENRETIPYDQLPHDLINAVVSVEDAKFYQHHGYAFSGILRATLKNLVAGHVRQGASTITQQLASNSYALIRMRDLGYIDSSKYAEAQAQDLAIGNRQNAQGQNYAVDYIRQQVINAVGWNRAMNEGFRIHTTIDGDLQKVAEESLRKHLDKAEQHTGYDHQTYAEYAVSFRKAKARG